VGAIELESLHCREALASGKRVQKIKLSLKYLLATFFAFAGVNHFINTDFYLRMMPPYLPAHFDLVYVSGALEILFGVLLVVRACTRVAAWSLIALLIAVFPANIHMAVNHALYPQYSAALLWFRLPLQFVLIAWAYAYTRPDEKFRSDNGLL
jgi:uncharacterized membrane protein